MAKTCIQPHLGFCPPVFFASRSHRANNLGRHVGPLSIVILISLSTENAFDLGVEHAEETRNVTSPARPLDGNRDNILGKKLIKRNIDPIPAETDKRALRDIIWVREADMQALSLEDPIAHQDKLPVMWHRRIQPRHRVTSFFGRRKLIDIDNCRHLNAPIRKQLESGATPFPGSRSANPHSCAPRHNARPRPRTH